MLPSVAVAVSLAVVVAFLLEPLVREADALNPLDRRREWGRPDVEATIECELEGTAVRCCRHCGQDVRQEYTFCGECARPVPR
jgi:hypothetical protein